jgi:hypothetical protein
MIYELSSIVDIYTPGTNGVSDFDEYSKSFYSGDPNYKRTISLKANKIEYNFSLENIYHELKVYIPKRDFNLYFNDVNGIPYISYKNSISMYKYDRIRVIMRSKNAMSEQKTDPDIYDFEIQDYKFEGDFLVIYANDDLIQLERMPRLKISAPSGITFRDLFYKYNIVPTDSTFYGRYLRPGGDGIKVGNSDKLLGVINPNIWDANIGQLDIVDEMSPIDILKKLKSSFPILYFYLRNVSHKTYIDVNGDYFMTTGSMNFNCGWKYWENDMIETQYKSRASQIVKSYELKYPFTNIDLENTNELLPVLQNNLTFNSKDKKYSLVKGVFQTKYKDDKGKDKTKSYTLYYSAAGYMDKLDNKSFYNDIININIKDNIPLESTDPLKATAKSILKSAYDNIPNIGWVGSLTLFGSPSIRVGDVLYIRNETYVKINLKYFVKSVSLSMSPQGYRRTLELENVSR